MPSPQSVLTDLREIFPGTTEHTLQALLGEIRDSTTSTGVLALLASLWLGSSFWGALDTAFGRIYGCGSRRGSSRSASRWRCSASCCCS